MLDVFEDLERQQQSETFLPSGRRGSEVKDVFPRFACQGIGNGTRGFRHFQCEAMKTEVIQFM